MRVDTVMRGKQRRPTGVITRVGGTGGLSDGVDKAAVFGGSISGQLNVCGSKRAHTFASFVAMIRVGVMVALRLL